MMTDAETEALVDAHCTRLRGALGLDRLRQGPLAFEAADAIQTALLRIAAEVQLGILDMPPDELSVMRVLAAAYGQMSHIALDLLEERTHRRAFAGTDLDDPDPDEDEEEDR